MALFPPFVSLSVDSISEEGWTIVRLLSSPITTGILIVFALGVTLTDDQVQHGKETSFVKEFVATQTVRRETLWNWPAILQPHQHRGAVIHPDFPHLSPLQRQFSRNLPGFRSTMSGRTILPHYSRRGISSQSASWLIARIDKRKPKYGSPRTFHRRFDRRNVTSLDVVHHYVRTGSWAPGKTEMKQRWYPSQLLPRTYFSWSGTDIAVSAYLRNFFNDLGDLFAPTHRHNRVQPDWLSTESPEHRGFLFYDLTSFTSWFHEQVPFLRSIADQFRGSSVFLVGENLTLSEHNLGSLIDAYTDYTTDFAEFVISDSLDRSDRTYKHQCAGFLGIPGNLITCTIAHGLALSSFFSDEHELQVPGDDVGAEFKSEEMRVDIMKCASSLGSLQFDKVYHQPQVSIYLKRLVIDLGNRISLAPMLIYPLLPYLIDPKTTVYRSNQYKLPDRDRLHSRAASVLVSFHRDLWKMTKGELDSDSEGIIKLLLRRIHDQVGLPYGAIFQGRLYGDDDNEHTHHYSDISVKFPVDDERFCGWNPDLHFASKYVTRMTIRATSEVEVSEDISDLLAGERIIVRNSKGWRFLEDMGYVRIIGIPGEKIELVGSDARDAFLFASEPSYREVEVLDNLDRSQLLAVGVVKDREVTSFENFERRGVFDENMQSWRYRRYVDLDDPRSAGFFGRSRDWVNDGLANLRSSLSPEPDMMLDY